MFLQSIFNVEIITPLPYGLFHIFSFLIVIELCIIAIFLAKRDSDKAFRIKLFIAWLIIVIFELYKQFLYNYNCAYSWWSFPYQFCSTPLYLLPLAAFLKDSKVRDSIMGFLSFFCLFGGLSVMVYPNSVFVTYLGINIQTMVHHGIQVISGVYIAVYNRNKLNFKYFLNSLLTFAVILLIAVGLNEFFYHVLDNKEINLFFISPYGTNHLPILSSIQTLLANSIGLVGKYLFVLVYGIGFSICGFLVYEVERLLLKRK